jgi:hypothetical protein
MVPDKSCFVSNIEVIVVSVAHCSMCTYIAPACTRCLLVHKEFGTICPKQCIPIIHAATTRVYSYVQVTNCSDTREGCVPLRYSHSTMEVGRSYVATGMACMS